MKILQLIDTLHPGGAERVALNYANSLLKYGVESHICISREKGILEEEILDGVKTHFLKKRSVLDIIALYRLIKIIKEYNINIVQAHGSSWFFAVIAKLSGLKFKLIWHDHYGNSEFLEKRDRKLLRIFSKMFDGIISVNSQLRNWAEKNLNCEKVILLNNFIKPIREINNGEVKLSGGSKLNLICVANLRPQKDHKTLLEAFKILKEREEGITLHLFGKEFNDEYSREIIQLIKSTPSVYWYGEKMGVSSYLALADIGILSSVSEGLPLSLLEYGNAGLGVVITDVGECKKVIGPDGLLIKPGDASELANAIGIYLQDAKRLSDDARRFQKKIKRLYSEDYVIPEYLSFCEKVC